MLAIVFASLAPAISHAFATQSAPLTLWQEICTAQGTKVISSLVIQSIESKGGLGNLDQQLDSQFESQSAQPHVGALEHCPFCFSHAGSVSLPPGDHILFVAALNATPVADDYQSSLSQIHFYSAHLSRAPPHLN